MGCYDDKSVDRHYAEYEERIQMLRCQLSAEQEFKWRQRRVEGNCDPSDVTKFIEDRVAERDKARVSEREAIAAAHDLQVQRDKLSYKLEEYAIEYKKLSELYIEMRNERDVAIARLRRETKRGRGKRALGEEKKA